LFSYSRLLCQLFLCLCRIRSEQLCQIVVVTVPRVSRTLFCRLNRNYLVFNHLNQNANASYDATTLSPTKEQIRFVRPCAMFSLLKFVKNAVSDMHPIRRHFRLYCAVNTLDGYVGPFVNLYVMFNSWNYKIA